MAKDGPTYATGKICYVEIPATDVERSAQFYHEVFGWPLRRHDDGTLAFDDGVGEVSGMFVTGRTPMGDAGIIISIMVSDAVAACGAIETAGGTIVRPIKLEAAEKIAWFKDPAGNLMGIYEERALTV